MAESEPLRVGDDERNKAVELLSDHLAEARLTQVEFNDRLSLALSAKTADELEALFEDLPGVNPGRPADLESLEAQDRRQASDMLAEAKARREVQARIDPKWLGALTVVTGLAWLASAILYFTVFGDWKLFVVPFALTIALITVRGSIR